MVSDALGSNASLLLATSTSAFKKAIDSSEDALLALVESLSSGETSSSSGLDIYA